MTTLLNALMHRGGYMAPAGDDGADTGGGGAVDRGDDFNPTPDAVDPAPEKEAAEAKKEEEEEPEPEPKAEAKEEEEEPQRDAKGRFIPKDRFDEAVRKERTEKEELARRLKEYEDKEAQRAVAADFAEAAKQVKDMIKQHTSLLSDGELDKASDLMEKILEMQQEMAARRASASAEQAKTAAKEEVRYDALVAKLEADFPQINPEAEEFDRAAVKKVQAYMTGLMQTEKMSPTQALKEAVETLLGATKKAEAPAKDKAEELGMRRKEDAVKKAIDAKTKQPATAKDVGIDHDKIGGPLDASAVMKMSWDEFVKLPESKLSDLRGDYVG